MSTIHSRQEILGPCIVIIMANIIHRATMLWIWSLTTYLVSLILNMTADDAVGVQFESNVSLQAQ